MLQDLANVAQIIGALAVVVAIAFGLLQVRQYRQQRRDAVAVELMRSIQDAEFTRSLRMLLSLPMGCTAEEFRSRGEAFEDAAIALIAKYETLGYLVFRGIMPIELVEELVGGVGIHLWERLQLWAKTMRDEQQQPLLFEWFQWLAEAMQRRGRLRAVPAYALHAGWVAPTQELER